MLKHCRGFSLLELTVTIIVIGLAASGLFTIMDVTARGSADPMLQKQAMVLAESMMNEIRLMPFTYCDPDDPTASSAVSASVGAGACTSTVEDIGPETIGGVTETRYGGTQVNSQFDNVSDYDGFSMGPSNGGIKDIAGNSISELSKFNVSVSVAPQGMGAAGAYPAIATSEALLITVTVTDPAGMQTVLNSIKTRFGPRNVP